LVQKSKANENEFVEIFNNIENIDTIPLSSEKKKSKKGTRRQRQPQYPQMTKITCIGLKKNEVSGIPRPRRLKIRSLTCSTR